MAEDEEYLDAIGVDMPEYDLPAMKKVAKAVTEAGNRILKALNGVAKQVTYATSDEPIDDIHREYIFKRKVRRAITPYKFRELAIAKRHLKYIATQAYIDMDLPVPEHLKFYKDRIEKGYHLNEVELWRKQDPPKSYEDLPY